MISSKQGIIEKEKRKQISCYLAGKQLLAYHPTCEFSGFEHDFISLRQLVVGSGNATNIMWRENFYGISLFPAFSRQKMKQLIHKLLPH